MARSACLRVWWLTQPREAPLCDHTATRAQRLQALGGGGCGVSDSVRAVQQNGCASGTSLPEAQSSKTHLILHTDRRGAVQCITVWVALEVESAGLMLVAFGTQCLGTWVAGWAPKVPNEQCDGLRTCGQRVVHRRICRLQGTCLHREGPKHVREDETATCHRGYCVRRGRAG